MVRAWLGQLGLHSETLYQYFKRGKKEGWIVRYRNSGCLQPSSMSQTIIVVHVSSRQLQLTAQDQTNQNPSMERGRAYKVPTLVEDLLAIDGIWGRDGQAIFKDAP